MKLTFLMAIPIVLCVGFASLADAQEAVLPQEKCSIEGTVVDAVSGQPLRGAEVRLRGFTPGATAPVAQSASAGTDANGRFVFEGLSAGRFRLMASHEGYLDDSRGNPGLRGKMLAVAPGQHVNDI